jgi:hypothetical protein
MQLPVIASEPRSGSAESAVLTRDLREAEEHECHSTLCRNLSTLSGSAVTYRQPFLHL